MKKIFSYVLMATALLISGQVKAEGTCKIGETSYLSLAEAVNAVTPGTLTTITMIADDEITTFNTPSNLTNQTNGAFGIVGGKKVILDLAGHTIDAHSISIKVYDGYLEITGPGTIKGSELTLQKLFYLYGSTNPTAENFSVLKIGKDVNVQASGEGKFAYGIMISANGNFAYGTVIDLDCFVETKGAKACPCVYINGTVNAVPGATTAAGVTGAPADAHVPQIFIRSNAELVCGGLATDADAAAIYGAGYAVWHINGAAMTGPTGIYAKGGVFEINDTEITATGDYSKPATNNNGISGGGSAIVFDSNGGYPGNMELNVSGDSKIVSEKGYALEELLTSANQTKTKSVEISGGVFDGGAEGCISTTPAVKQEIVNNSTLTGGIFDEDISEYVNNANKVITYVDTEDGFHKWTIGNIPSGQEWKEDFNTENSYVQLNHAVATTTEVTGTKNIAYLAILGQDSVIVKANARLNVGEVVLGEDAVLIIEPKAMVVVTSTQGIISTNDEQLIIKADANNYGQLLINPGVTFNTQPRATVEITTRSFRKSSTDYLYERFAIPTGLMVDEVSCSNSKEVRFAKYDDDQDQWVILGYLNPTGAHEELDPNDLNVPFVDYQFLVNTPDAGEKVTFKCKLVGNADTEMQLKGHWWNGFGNSYVAEMDVEELLAVLKDKFQGSSENIAIYVYVCTNKVKGIYEWKSITEMNLATKLKLNPMEVFLIKNDGNGITMPISYKDLLWDPATEPAE